MLKTSWQFRYLFCVTCLLIAASLVTAAFLCGGLSSIGGSRLSDITQGTGAKPYVYRLLIPKTAGFLEHYTPQNIKDQISQYGALFQERAPIFANMLNWEKDFFIEYFYAYLITAFMFFATLLILWFMTSSLYDINKMTACLLMIWGCITLPFYFRYSSYAYDPGALFFAALLTLLVFFRKRLLFFLVFPLAVLNKETALFLVPFYYFREVSLRDSQKRVLLEIASLVICWVAIKGMLTWIYYDNAGSIAYFQPYRNFRIVLYHKLRFANFFIFFVFWGVLILQNLKEKPAWLVKGLFVSLPIVLLLTFMSGWIDELRIYLDLFPAFFLLASHTIFHMMKEEEEMRQSPS